MPMRHKGKSREIEIGHPSYKPSRAELEEDLRLGAVSTMEEFERAARALVQPVSVTYVEHPTK